MKRNTLLDTLSQGLKDFTIYDIKEKYEFGKGLPEKERKRRQPRQPVKNPYDARKDDRFKEAFAKRTAEKVANAGSAEMACVLTACLDEYFLDDRFGGKFEEPIRDDEAAKLLSASGYSREEMDDYSDWISYRFLFYIRSDDARILILQKLIYDAICGGQKESERLIRTVEYMRKEGLIPESQLTEGNEEAPYEAFVSKVALETCKYGGAMQEFELSEPYFEKEALYLCQQDPEGPPMFHADRPWGANYGQLPSLSIKTAVKRDKIDKLSKLDAYRNRIYLHGKEIANSAKDEICSMEFDLPAVAESMVWAITHGDEVCQMRLVYYAIDVLKDRLGIGILRYGTDEEFNKAVYVYGRTENEETIPVYAFGEDEIQYTQKKEPDEPEDAEQFVWEGTITGLITEMAGACPQEVSIRPDTIELFRRCGLPEEQARDCAVVVETIRALDIPDVYIFAKCKETDGEKKEYEAMEKRCAVLEAKNRELEATVQALRKEAKQHRHEVLEMGKKLEAVKKESRDRNKTKGEKTTEREPEAGKGADAPGSTEGIGKTIGNGGPAGQETNGGGESSGNRCGQYEKRGQMEDGQMEREDTDGQIAKIQFPYRTDKKIVLFGGFQTFHQELTRLLPDVRVIAPMEHLDVAPVQNADILFVQTNKANHSGYWTVIDAAKKAGVPFMHLNNASPRICAEQIVGKVAEMG